MDQEPGSDRDRPAGLAPAGGDQQRVFAPVENSVTTKIGEREGLRIRSDEAGNLMVDPLEREAEQASDAQATGAPGKPAAITIATEIREDNRLRQLADLAFGRYFLLLAWGALYFALVAAEQARIAERRGHLSPCSQGGGAAFAALSGQSALPVQHRIRCPRW